MGPFKNVKWFFSFKKNEEALSWNRRIIYDKIILVEGSLGINKDGNEIYALELEHFFLVKLC